MSAHPGPAPVRVPARIPDQTILMPKPRLFCSKPFTWFEVSRGNLGGEGDTFLCCPTWLPVPVGNLNQQSVSEVWNGSQAEAIRRSILDGTFAHCVRANCPHLQAGDGPVMPADAVTDPQLRSAIDNQLTVLPWGPRDINCSYDRSCNLSCPSCRAELIVETAASDRIERIQRRLTEEALGDARLLYITGSGDPFGSPYFRRWLQTMRRASMPQLERIHLHTNGLLWTPARWASIPADVRELITTADISIDAATAATYATNRRGGRFEVLLTNLAFVRELRTSGPLRHLSVSMTVQDNNVAEMRDFVRLGQHFAADTVYFGHLVDWGTYPPGGFEARAVHLPGHPRHHALVAMLADPVFAGPPVLLGNLSGLRRQAVRHPSLRERLRRSLGLASRWARVAADRCCGRLSPR